MPPDESEHITKGGGVLGIPPPGKVYEAVRIYRDVLNPDIKQQQGFKAAFLLIDPTTGQGVSITMWETEADLKAAVPVARIRRTLLN